MVFVLEKYNTTTAILIVPVHDRPHLWPFCLCQLVGQQSFLARPPKHPGAFIIMHSGTHTACTLRTPTSKSTVSNSTSHRGWRTSGCILEPDLQSLDTSGTQMCQISLWTKLKKWSPSLRSDFLNKMALVLIIYRTCGCSLIRVKIDLRIIYPVTTENPEHPYTPFTSQIAHKI